MTLGRKFVYGIGLILCVAAVWLGYGEFSRSRIPSIASGEPTKALIAIPDLENFSRVNEIYVKNGALFVDVERGTPSAIQSTIADQAGKFYLSTHKEVQFLQVYVTRNGFHSLAALYDGSAAGKGK